MAQTLHPHRLKSRIIKLYAYQAFEITQLCMACFQPQIAAFRFENGTGCSIVKFGMGIVSLALLAFDAANKTTEITNLSFKRIAIRLDADGHKCFCRRAVVAAVSAGRRAQVSVGKQ